MLPADFNVSSGKATFLSGVSTYGITVTIVDDTLVETDETFEIALEETSITGGPGQVDTANDVGVGTIVNDDTYTISIDNSFPFSFFRTTQPEYFSR